MINCKYCGTHLNEFVNFCNVCGKQVVSFNSNTQSTDFKQQNPPGFNKVSVTVPNIKKASFWIIAGILFLFKLSLSDAYISEAKCVVFLVTDGFIFLFLFISLGRAFSKINGKNFSIDKIKNKLSITAIIFYILGGVIFIYGLKNYIFNGTSVRCTNIFLDGLIFSILFIGFGKFFTKIKNHIGSQQTNDSKEGKI